VKAPPVACTMYIIYGGLGISKWQFFILKKFKKFQLHFFQFLLIKTLDPDSLKMLDPDPDPQH
jgi:hypothetical protein